MLYSKDVLDDEHKLPLLRVEKPKPKQVRDSFDITIVPFFILFFLLKKYEFDIWVREKFFPFCFILVEIEML